MSEGQLVFNFMTDTAVGDLDNPMPAMQKKHKKHYVEDWDVNGTYTRGELLHMARTISPQPERLLRVIRELWP